MTDWTDAASELEQRERDAALAAHQARIAESMRGSTGGPTHCEDCGGAIEPARRLALPMTGRCAACAHLAEQRLREASRFREAACPM